MKRSRVVDAANAFMLFVLLGLPVGPASMAASESAGLSVHTEDVARFYEVYESAHRHPTADELQREYIDPGSPGLHHLAKIRNVTGVTIAKALAAHPQIFAVATRCMAVLPRARQRVTAALQRLDRLHSHAKFPPVTIAISRGNPWA